MALTVKARAASRRSQPFAPPSRAESTPACEPACHETACRGSATSVDAAGSSTPAWHGRASAMKRRTALAFLRAPASEPAAQLHQVEARHLSRRPGTASAGAGCLGRAVRAPSVRADSTYVIEALRRLCRGRAVVQVFQVGLWARLAQLTSPFLTSSVGGREALFHSLW